ncbi:MAG: tRNA dihydrouridine(20/20a) synthase DusA [Alphaproteobacteria bacterium]|nr:tRNA dihydrouridine(20/20a) synthase DusA [Alphaproteobacteria bacterium]
MTANIPSIDETLSVAPMMDWTDRHFRVFMRQFTKKTLLYSEMVTANAICYGNYEKLLSFSKLEKPIVLQLGGADPEALAKAIKIANDFDYDGYNLNCGCPSQRVQNGNFGAALRKDPNLVNECYQAIIESTNKPTSIKTRISLLEMTLDSDGYDDLCNFTTTIKNCNSFTIHARKAKLSGFNPKQNRDRLAINYDLVYKFKKEHPNLKIIINGDIKNLCEAKNHLNYVDGVMIGRAAYSNPQIFQHADSQIYNCEDTCLDLKSAILNMEEYIENELLNGEKLSSITRHFLGLFKGCTGASIWRRSLSEIPNLNDASFKTILQALNNVVSI